jgi:predicted NAD/FAD-binding protein
MGQFLLARGYSSGLIEHYVIPMGSAIWSADRRQMLDMPARFFLQFFKNHGMLSVDRRPQWRVIIGGSHRYIEPLTNPYREKVRVACPIRSIRRYPDHVAVTPAQGSPERYDHVVLASHSDQTLALLADPSPQEREILGALPYQENEAVLHTDETILPKRRLAWAAWNYHLLRENTCRSTLTYNMNILQSLDAPKTLCVTLNRADVIDPNAVLRRIIYHHPVYTRAGVAAQRRHGEISGVNRTSYCGAYWGFGFHEDGVKSALAVCREFGKAL